MRQLGKAEVKSGKPDSPQQTGSVAGQQPSYISLANQKQQNNEADDRLPSPEKSEIHVMRHQPSAKTSISYFSPHPGKGSHEIYLNFFIQFGQF